MSAAAATTDADRLLLHTQQLIEGFYAVQAPHAAADFLLQDADAARALHGDGWNDTDEALLVREDDGDLALSLFVDRAVFARLADASPHADLGAHNLADFWTLVEGVSHFVYLTWNAARARSVTPLELELQGEVDKYALSALLWQAQQGGSPRALHRLLFDRAQVGALLPPALRERYRDANRYAGRYCLDIERRFVRARREGLVDELRAFYRQDRGGKLARIGTP